MAHLPGVLLPPLAQPALLSGITVRRSQGQSPTGPGAAPLASSGKQWPR